MVLWEGFEIERSLYIGVREEKNEKKKPQSGETDWFSLSFLLSLMAQLN